jgi:hypothetical protein
METAISHRVTSHPLWAEVNRADSRHGMTPSRANSRAGSLGDSMSTGDGAQLGAAACQRARWAAATTGGAAQELPKSYSDVDLHQPPSWPANGDDEEIAEEGGMPGTLALDHVYDVQAVHVEPLSTAAAVQAGQMELSSAPAAAVVVVQMEPSPAEADSQRRIILRERSRWSRHSAPAAASVGPSTGGSGGAEPAGGRRASYEAARLAECAALRRRLNALEKDCPQVQETAL